MKSFAQVILLVLLFCGCTIFAQPLKQYVYENGDVRYLSGQLIIKLKDAPLPDEKGTVTLSSSVVAALQFTKPIDAKLVFPNAGKTRDPQLGAIVSVTFLEDIDPSYVAAKISGNPEVDWAEPKFVYVTEYIPNDPSYNSQWNLAKIQASLAWDVTKGDTTMIIGIIDTGIDWDHPDLYTNIWKNSDEANNPGVDGDGNGYNGDWIGWDFGGMTGIADNNPMEDRADHGTHVAGIVSAVSDNALGISSIGFSCRIMAVKTTQDNYRQNGTGPPYIVFGYEGIVYAVDNGAKVINCSWGGGGFSMLGQVTINYALAHGTLVVGAAGNSNSPLSHYPSSYKGVLSVAATNQSDMKAGFSNYGKDVDVSSPGTSIYATWMNDTYATLDGTSMASPLVAGLAALVAVRFPTLSPTQWGEQVRASTENIDALNPAYVNKLGKGRISANNALLGLFYLAARSTQVTFTDIGSGNGNGIFEAGETITVLVDGINYLRPVTDLSITLESKTGYATVVNSTFNAGALGTMGTFSNTSAPFTFTLANSLPENSAIDFQLLYTDAAQDDWEWISTVANPTYATPDNGEVAMTITSKGTLGFNNYPDNSQGAGFKFRDNENALFEGALILGTASNKIVNAARGNNSSSQDEDFTVVTPFTLDIPGVYSDIEGTSQFSDVNAGATKIGLSANFSSYLFSDAPHDNYFILRYQLINTSPSQISNLHAGLFFDWDMIDGTGDLVSYDDVGNFSYVSHQNGSPDYLIGVALISHDSYKHCAIANDGTTGPFQIYDDFTDDEKWQALTSLPAQNRDAGPGDISMVNAGGPFVIEPGDTADVAFAIFAALTIEDLRAAVERAHTRFPFDPTGVNDGNPVPYTFSVEQNFPNPFNPSTTIAYSIADEGNVTIKIYDVLGAEVAEVMNTWMKPGRYEAHFDAAALSSGVYFYEVRSNENVKRLKMLLIK